MNRTPRPLLLGIIAEKDGMICLQTGANVWYPLDGNSGIAERFRESFNAPQRSDLGKRLYNFRGSITMENDAQKAEREARESGS
jgi:hypothetical protein